MSTSRADLSGESWMRALAEHYRLTRARKPQAKHLLLFDIDGTIVDMRHQVVGVLRAYDRAHGTTLFRELFVDDEIVRDEQIDDLLEVMRVPEAMRPRVIDWYETHRWTQETMLECHRPFRGVLDVIRWFQLQPHTYVGLVTGRSEEQRDVTLAALNRIGEEYRVRFADGLLFMKPRRWKGDVPGLKAAGVQHFRDRGYDVFGMVDNELENLLAVAVADPEQEIVLLHADTIFESRTDGTETSARREYDVTELIHEHELPRHLQFVWHGVNDSRNLDAFLQSTVHWCEMDVRQDPVTGEPVLHHDALPDQRRDRLSDLPRLETFLRACRDAGRGVKLDLKEGGIVLRRVLDCVARVGFHESDLWFNGNVEVVGRQGFELLAETYPRSIRQCPVDGLTPMILEIPARAFDMLRDLRSWGIDRYSIAWRRPFVRRVFERLSSWGCDVNIYDVPDLAAFLQAALLMPRSVTSDFNFPKWRHHGLGSGAREHADTGSP